ncbi:hypothetical protein QE152_g8998 [Popillia japonica]|uniref:Uncharacterized protein n=1 Tax=Popillia japonica TaxID=7064 RepID=A0AAW1LW11_POPJA
MPLHGYPKNKMKLEELDKDVQQFLQEKSEEYVEPVNEYRKLFNEKELEFTVGLFKVNDSMKALEIMFEKNTHLSKTLSELLETLLWMKNVVMVPQDFDTDDSVLLSEFDYENCFNKIRCIG